MSRQSECFVGVARRPRQFQGGRNKGAGAPESTEPALLLQPLSGPILIVFGNFLPEVSRLTVVVRQLKFDIVEFFEELRHLTLLIVQVGEQLCFDSLEVLMERLHVLLKLIAHLPCLLVVLDGKAFDLVETGLNFLANQINVLIELFLELVRLLFQNVCVVQVERHKLSYIRVELVFFLL